MVLKLEWNPLHPRTPLIQISGAFALLEPPFHLFFSFFCCSDFAAASYSSCSSSTPATASSLVSALYLIRMNDIVVLIRLHGCQL